MVGVSELMKPWLLQMQAMSVNWQPEDPMLESAGACCGASTRLLSVKPQMPSDIPMKEVETGRRRGRQDHCGREGREIGTEEQWEEDMERLTAQEGRPERS